MRSRNYDPRTNRGNRGLVSSIAAGWRDEQKKMPRMSATSQRMKTYRGAPQHEGPLSSSMILDRSDPAVSFGGSTRDMTLSRNMRLQNISSHRKVSEPDPTAAAPPPPTTGPKRPSFPKGVAKAMRRSVRHIFVNKSEFAAADIEGFSDSETNIEYPEQDHSRRTSISINDFDSPLHDSHNLNDASALYDSNIFEGTGRIPVLTAKKKDTTSKRGRSKRKKEEENKEEEEGYEADYARTRSRSESILGRMRRRTDEQRKRRGRGHRGSVSPKRTSMPASPISPRKKVGFLRSSTAISTSDIARAALENMNRNSNRSLLEEAKLASDVFHNSTKEKDRTLSTHSSLSRGMGSDFFSDPEGVDGSIREGSRRARVAWGTDLDGSSRHSRTVAEVLMDYSNSGAASFRSQIPVMADNSLSHGLSAARLNSSIAEQPEHGMDSSNGSLPHLSPFSSVANSSYQGGTPYFASVSPYESDDADPMELSKRGSDHRRRQNKKGRQHDNLQASDHTQFNQASEAKASSNTRASRIAKDPTEILRSSQQPSQRLARRHRQREMAKMSSSDRTHEVRRTRLSVEEPKLSRRRSLEQDISGDRSGAYGSVMEKQTKQKGSRGSSIRRKAGLDSSDSQMKQRRQSKSVRGRSKSNRNSSEEPGTERRKSSGRKGRRQSSNSKSKTRSSSEGERRRSLSKKPKSSKPLKHKLEEKVASDNEEDGGSVEWSRVASPVPKALNPDNVAGHNVDAPEQSDEDTQNVSTAALNPSNHVNDALPPLEGSGMDRTKLTRAGANFVANDIAPGPRSYHPRTQPLVEGTSNKPVSKSYHGGSEARSKAKKDSSKERRDSGKKKKKKKSLEPKNLNDVDLTSLGPDQIRALLQRNTVNGRAQERERSGEIRKKSRRPSLRPKREGSERIKSRSTKKTEEERRSRSRSNSKQNKTTKDVDKSDHEGSMRKKKHAKEYGEDEIRRSFTEEIGRAHV